MGTGVLVVDDEPDIRLMVSALIDAANDGLRWVGEAADGTEAIALIDTLAPDVVVLDHRMPGLTGVETARRLLSAHPDLRIILYSGWATDHDRDEALDAGVATFVDKSDTDCLVSALRVLQAS